MDKLEKLQLMDRIARELDELHIGQTAVLKKLGQIEADNINLGNTLLEKKLPALFTEVDARVAFVSKLMEEFQEQRNKYYTDNNIASLEDPTAKSS